MPVRLAPSRAPNTISEVCSWGQDVGLKLGLGERLGDGLWVAAIAEVRNPKNRCKIIPAEPGEILTYWSKGRVC